MGEDFHNYQVHAGEGGEPLRTALLEAASGALRARGYRELAEHHEHGRSLAIGPAGRWITLFLSKLDFDDEPKHGGCSLLERVAQALSSLAPTVSVHMCDSCAVSLDLYRGGEVVDEYCTGPFFEEWPPARWERTAGQPDRYQSMLAEGATAEALRRVWDGRRAEDRDVYEILAGTARLLGWPEELYALDYLTGWDGLLEDYYQECIEPELAARFAERHFLHGHLASE